MTKKCPRCGLTKAHSEFSKNRSNKSGLDVYCRECRREFNRQQHEDEEKTPPELNLISYICMGNSFNTVFGEGVGRKPKLDMWDFKPGRDWFSAWLGCWIPRQVRKEFLGMEMLDQSLIKLYLGGLISRQSLLAFCNDPDEVVKRVVQGS